MSTQSPAQLLETALKEIEKLQAYDEASRAAYLKTTEIVPPNVPVGNGYFVLTTREGLKAIHDLADTWRAGSTNAKHGLTPAAAVDWMLHEFGAQFTAGALAHLTDYPAAAAKLSKQLDLRLGTGVRKVVYSFPCRLFDDLSIGPFDIGPVRFCPRSDWLHELEARAQGASDAWAKPLQNFFSAPVLSIIDRESKLSVLPDRAQQVHDALSGCMWVATVSLAAIDQNRAKDRAQTAVRLAVNALGLRMNRLGAFQLRGPGDELRATQSHTIVQPVGEDVRMGIHLNLPRSGGSPGQSKAYVLNSLDLRQAAGVALAAITSPTRPAKAKEPTIAQRWCDALFWFGEARRDSTEFMALVRYGMALDVLAKGSRKKGIIDLLQALFGIKAIDAVTSNGTTLESLVRRIYDEGRSQFGHGGRSALIQDLPASIETADQLTSQALDRYALCLASYTGSQDYESFLAAIPSCLPRSRASMTANSAGSAASSSA
jgi:hypothetical protein